MGGAQRYLVPAARATSEIVVDRSRFVCTIDRATSPAMARAVITELQQRFASATHNCWAFNAGPPRDAAQVGLSDDGEPHGTAGRPMLTVLTHSGVGELVAVVTRYYGGVKLGTGGLARAYAAAVQATLAQLPTVERVDWCTVTVRVTYAQHAGVVQLLAPVEAQVFEEHFAEDVRLRVRLPVEQLDALRRRVADATAGSAEVLLDEEAVP